MLNFGIAELRLVNPQTDHLSEAARKRAAGAVAVLENAKVHPTVAAPHAGLSRTRAAGVARPAVGV